MAYIEHMAITMNYESGGYAVTCDTKTDSDQVMMITALAEHVAANLEMDFDKLLEFMKFAKKILDGKKNGGLHRD